MSYLADISNAAGVVQLMVKETGRSELQCAEALHRELQAKAERTKFDVPGIEDAIQTAAFLCRLLEEA